VSPWPSPPELASTLVAKSPIVKYRAVCRDTASICCALSTGAPIIAGIEVYETFCSQETARTGVVALPRHSEQRLGTHACLICGYTADNWICRNSFGPDWGMRGNFTLPRSYLTSDFCFDLWVLSDLNFEREIRVEL
jgi:C1A family cysteine protease